MDKLNILLQKNWIDWESNDWAEMGLNENHHWRPDKFRCPPQVLQTMTGEQWLWDIGGGKKWQLTASPKHMKTYLLSICKLSLFLFFDSFPLFLSIKKTKPILISQGPTEKTGMWECNRGNFVTQTEGWKSKTGDCCRSLWETCSPACFGFANGWTWRHEAQQKRDF